MKDIGFVFSLLLLLFCYEPACCKHLLHHHGNRHRSRTLWNGVTKRSETMLNGTSTTTTVKNATLIQNTTGIPINVIKSFKAQEEREEAAEKRSHLYRENHKQRRWLPKKTDKQDGKVIARTVQRDGRPMSAIVVIGNKTHRISGPVVKALLADVKKNEEEEEERKQKPTQETKQKITNGNAVSEIGQSGSANSKPKLKRLQAATEVAEINKLLGKPLTDEKALSFIKTLLLHQVHNDLAKTMDQKPTDLLSVYDNNNNNNKNNDNNVDVNNRNINNNNNNNFNNAEIGPTAQPPANPGPVMLKEGVLGPVIKAPRKIFQFGPPLCKDMDKKERCLYFKELGLCVPGNESPKMKRRCQETCSICNGYQPCNSCSGLCAGCTVDLDTTLIIGGTEMPPPALSTFDFSPSQPLQPLPSPAPTQPLNPQLLPPCCKDDKGYVEEPQKVHPCKLCEKAHPDDFHLESALCKICSKGTPQHPSTPSPPITHLRITSEPDEPQELHSTHIPGVSHPFHHHTGMLRQTTLAPGLRHTLLPHSTLQPPVTHSLSHTTATRPNPMPADCGLAELQQKPECLNALTATQPMALPCRARPTHNPHVTNALGLSTTDIDCSHHPTQIPPVTSEIGHATLLPTPSVDNPHQVVHPLTQPPMQPNGILAQDDSEHHIHPLNLLKLDPSRPNPVHPVNPLLDPDNPLHLENVDDALDLDPIRLQELKMRRPENILIGGQCSLAVDIGIAVDISAAASKHWPQLKNFITALLTRFLSTGRSHFGIITFSTVAKLEIPLGHARFNLATLLKRLDKIQPHPQAMQRRTDSALDVAKEMFLNSRPGVTKVLIVLEHGGIRGGDPSVDWKALEEEPAERLRNIGVNIFVVGTTPIADIDEMQMVSGSESHSIQLQSYNELSGIIPPLVSKVCNIASVVKRSKSPAAPNDDQIQSKKNCRVKFTKVGCFRDDQNSPRPLPTEILNDIGHIYPAFSGRYIDWSNWNKYYKEFICRCATESQRRGFKMFGIQGFATCRSGAKAEETYNQDGSADKSTCIANSYRKCDVTDSLCVGKNETNFVYRIND